MLAKARYGVLAKRSAETTYRIYAVLKLLRIFTRTSENIFHFLHYPVALL